MEKSSIAHPVQRSRIVGIVRLYARLFFFQAEDGIRDDLVTGVQTCALPIFRIVPARGDFGYQIALKDLELRGAGNLLGPEQSGFVHAVGFDMYLRMLDETVKRRSEERRVGKSVGGGGRRMCVEEKRMRAEVG